uniref:Uncharacterized protein n=1 Tax=Ralstonia solanacearum TaxID=305 RepID=A0A0S4VW59_RALSL|nr:protein of unknown function [Ralstonia solanacearum]
MIFTISLMANVTAPTSGGLSLRTVVSAAFRILTSPRSYRSPARDAYATAILRSSRSVLTSTTRFSSMMFFTKMLGAALSGASRVCRESAHTG